MEKSLPKTIPTAVAPYCWACRLISDLLDTSPDPYLHKLIESADIVMPWMVQRFTPLLQFSDATRYEAEVKADIAWCDQRHLDYAPCVSAGFSWYNMHHHGRGNNAMLFPLNQIPRQKGRFY